ncbi:MAG: SDR family NAD(P)-dependent oxidoreductase [Bdellovibrionales bacterium]
MKWTLITGASSGIGLACAEVLAREQKPVWLLARRGDRLKDLAAKFDKRDVEVKINVLDVRNPEAVSQFAAQEKTHLEQVETLINNAGLARGVAPIQSGRFEDWQEMIETNVMGLLRLTQLVLPKMCERKAGHIVNIGSVAGRWGYPGGNVYSASKSAVHMLSESMRLDLLGTGVRVSEILPGMVETEFSLVRLQDEARAKAIYSGLKPLSAEDVAQAVVWCMSRPAHVNIQEVVIYPTAQAAPGHVHRKNMTVP